MTRMLRLTILCLMLASCGGSGPDGSGNEGSVHVPQPATGTARLVIGTQGPTADTVLYAVQLTLRLPAGVSVATAVDGTMAADGVLVPYVSGSFSGASVVEQAGAGSGALLRINVTNPNGFTVGPLATLICNVAPDAPPTAAGFIVEAFSARDANGGPMVGITPHLTL